MSHLTHFSKTVVIGVFNYSEVSEQIRLLLVAASDVRGKAQAPYSKYYVGAAVRSKSGRIYVGCNVERVTYTQATHAEQNAVDSMVAAEGSAKIEAVAVIGGPRCPAFKLEDKPEGKPVVTAPCCGHCLQIIWENCYGDPGVKIISRLRSGHIIIASIDDVLPLRFGPEDLGINYQKQS